MKVKVGSVILGLVVIACLQQETFAGTIVSWGSMKTPYDGLTGVAGVAAGGGHALFLRADGSIFGWGNSDFGQATAPAGNDFIAIAAGGEHSLALSKDGSIVGWGASDSGQTMAPDGNDFIAIGAGWGYSLALKRGEEETCNFKVAGDLNNDCLVNLYDFAAFAGDWLVDCSAVPTDPGCIPK